MNDKLKGLNLDPPGPEMRVALDSLRDNIDLMCEYEKLQAKQIRARYLALVKEGFSDASAIELCKKP